MMERSTKPEEERLEINRINLCFLRKELKPIIIHNRDNSSQFGALLN